MRILVPGHRFALKNMGNDGEQIVQFIQKAPHVVNPDDPVATVREFVTVEEGTTNEEVLLMVLARLNYLNVKMPCRENALAITKLEEALMWLDRRTASRTARGVEGTPLP
jgi:hypothetical protein